MRSVGVVVDLVLRQHLEKVSAAGNENQVEDLDATTANRLGLGITSGALVVGVEPGSPAAGAGISASAVITSLDGTTIDSADALGPAIHAHGPGDQVRVTWVDSNGTHASTMTLVPGPAV